MPYSFSPIGVVHSAFRERMSAPRQPDLVRGGVGELELFRCDDSGQSLALALSDLDGWEWIWVLFVFHLNTERGWRPKVLPPRSEKKRGLFATRSPYRPNPIGLSAVRLESIDRLRLRVSALDILDGSPILDIKPYIPYADSHPQARTGWLQSLMPPAAAEAPVAIPVDPEPGFTVTWSERARAETDWLLRECGEALCEPIEHVLSLGPQQHSYRRIRAEEGRYRLGYKEWYVYFEVDGRTVLVTGVNTGFLQVQFDTEDDPTVAMHRAYVMQFPASKPLS